jgi:DNA-binding response OmpR family regulator
MPRRILAIDANESIHELYREILTDAGFDVCIRPYILLGRDEIARLQPDLAILDYVPGDEQPGWQTLQNLQMWRASLPIIVCTTWLRFSQKVAGAGSENVRFLPKPFDVDELLDTIRTLLDGS